MKKLLILLLMLSLFFSACQNNNTNAPGENDSNPPSESITKKDDQGISGSFQLEIGDQKINSTNYRLLNTDFTYMYKGEKSFVGIRLKDDQTGDNLLITLYGDESFIQNPDKEITRFMLSKEEGSKANIQFLKGNDPQFVYNGLTMVNGTLTLTKFDKGEMIGSFAGFGAKGADLVTQNNLIPFSGKVTVKTPNVTESGNKE